MQKLLLQNLTEQIHSYAKSNLTEARYLHSVRVAEYAAHLAALHQEENVPPELAYFAGLAHDICKECTDEQLLQAVKDDGLGLDDIEKKRLNLLHGRAAAAVLKNEFGVTDTSVLNAIAFHTLGYDGIDALGKIVYAADKIEPARSGTESLRAFAESSSLDELLIKIIEKRNNDILQKGDAVHSLTKKMYERLIHK